MPKAKIGEIADEIPDAGRPQTIVGEAARLALANPGKYVPVEGMNRNTALYHAQSIRNGTNLACRLGSLWATIRGNVLWIYAADRDG